MFPRRQRGVLPLALALGLALLPALVPVTLAARGLSLTTQYPALTVTPGTQVSLDLAVAADEAATVELSLSGVPATWKAEIRGGGYVVDAVHVDGTDPVTVRLDVDVPQNATGTTRITVTASATGTTVELPISITATVGAGGTVELTTDAPALQGPSDTAFTFNLTLRNDKEEDLTFTADARGPSPDWDVQAKGATQGQAVSGSVKAGSASALTVTVSPPENVAVGTYPIDLSVTVGGETLTQALEIVITGTYSLSATTPTGVLSGRGSAGGVTDQQWEITNTGTAPLTNVDLTTTPPSGWKVTFEPESVASLAPNETTTIVAHITPSSEAIAGDYSMTFRAGADEAKDVTATFRFTVEASLLGAIIGAGLIVLVFAGLYWVFRRYGRR